MKKDTYIYRKPMDFSDSKRSIEDNQLVTPTPDSLTKENTPIFETPDIINALPKATYKFNQ